MKLYYFVFKILLYTFIFLGISNSLYSKVSDFNQDAKNISNYFSGVVAFNNFDYSISNRFFDNFSKSNNTNKKFSSDYMQSLINQGKYSDAYNYSKRLERKKISNFESNLFLGLYEFKNKNYSDAISYFNNLEPTFEHQFVFDPLKISLINWSKIVISSNTDSIELIKSMSPNYKSLKSIQEIFANCYLDSANTENYFSKVINDKTDKFYRYNFFFANYLIQKGDRKKSESIINSISKKFPRNLLINQFVESLENNEKNENKFNCKNPQHILAEIFYTFANALSVQKQYKLSNFYINFSKYLNPNFLSYNALLAENLVMLKKYDQSRKIYEKLFTLGSFYKWHASKEISLILEEQGKEEDSVKFLKKIYDKIKINLYRTFDFANFLKSHKKYDESIKLYSKILKQVDKNHPLYPKVLDRRGTAYERTGDWKMAEKDLMLSLEILPDQPYTINYLAYTWIEKNVNTKQALTMLKKANNLKKNDGYITDSLGWALYKLKNFSEAKIYLELAIKIMPNDPIINDHFADCLWMNNKKIQARYYWNYVLSLEDTEQELRNKIENKLLFGLEKS